jgi:hypothetical protein
MNKRTKIVKRKKINKIKLARQMQTPAELKNGITIFKTAAWIRRAKAIRDSISNKIKKRRAIKTNIL